LKSSGVWANRLVLALFLSVALGAAVPKQAQANQMYEPMADHVKLALATALRDSGAVNPIFDSAEHRIDWLSEMSARLQRKVPDFNERYNLIKLVRYEAQRAGLDPQLVFSVIEVESGFQPEAKSPVGAIGLMQIMPFWTKVLSTGQSNQLFDARINIRSGCLILRHYMEIERGNLFRALGRYNGSLGKNTYPDKIMERYYGRWAYLSPDQKRKGNVLQVSNSGYPK
jgi:soluble lytic murein transglycosylase-like protein